MYAAEGVFNAQISEQSAARFAAHYTTNDGYAEHVPSGASLEGGTQWGARAQLRHEAGAWSFLGGLDYSEDDMDGHARVPVTASATNPAFVALVDTLRAGLDERQSFSSPNNYQERSNWGATFHAERSGQAFDFVSLTSYRSNDYRWRDNLGGLPFRASARSRRPAAEDSNQFSQEFPSSRRPSRASAGSWRLHLHEEVDRSERFRQHRAADRPAQFRRRRDLHPGRGQELRVFGQATIPFADIWELTAGLRWSHDEREVLQQAIDNDSAGVPPPAIPLGPGGAPYAATGSETFEEPTWRLALSVEPVEDVRFYVSYDRGYKAGAFISTAQTAAQAVRPIESEILDNYAVGAKTTLFGGRLRLNAEGFFLDYNDLQVDELLGLTLVSSNATRKCSGPRSRPRSRSTRTSPSAAPTPICAPSSPRTRSPALVAALTATPCRARRRTSSACSPTAMGRLGRGAERARALSVERRFLLRSLQQSKVLEDGYGLLRRLRLLNRPAGSGSRSTAEPHRRRLPRPHHQECRHASPSSARPRNSAAISQRF